MKKVFLLLSFVLILFSCKDKNETYYNLTYMVLSPDSTVKTVKIKGNNIKLSEPGGCNSSGFYELYTRHGAERVIHDKGSYEFILISLDDTHELVHPVKERKRETKKESKNSKQSRR